MCLKKSGTGLKRILALSLLLLVVLSHSAYSEVILTDEEWMTLNQSLETSDKALAKAQDELEKSDEKLATAEKRLEKAESTSAMLEQKSKEQEKQIEQLSTFFKEQKKEQRKQKLWTGIKLVGAFVIGGAVGYTAGSLF